MCAKSFSDWPAAIILGLFLGDTAAALGDFVKTGRLNVENEFDESTRNESRGKMSGEVMVKEKLATHDEEGNVVSSPGEEEETSAVVQARASACG